VVTAKVESSLAKAQVHDHFQLLKQGYFVVDDDATPEHLILNRTCSLKDNYLK
jgi:glutaminyl-tRNA synthetase